MIYIKKILFVLLLIAYLFSTGCSGLRTVIISKDIQKEIKNSPVFNTHLTGFCLYDPVNNVYLSQYQDHFYFVPASNTKILTAFACINDLDSIYSFKYRTISDTIYISPMGDPTFLHPDFENQPGFDFLKKKKVAVQFPEARLTHFGPGWAWDDYPFTFQPELSWFPIYSNTVRIHHSDSLLISPSFFENYTDLKIGMKPGDLAYRERNFNVFRIWMASDTSTFERIIPFVQSEELTIQLLSEALGRLVTPTSKFVTFDSLGPGQPLEPVLELMMKRSDNFLAEQLLIHAASRRGFSSTDSYRNALLTKWQPFLPHEIQWVDGSGLSRYNLITPRSLVAILNEIYMRKGMDYIKNIFPAGGVSGTLKNWYPSDTDNPYVYGKTGTLKNNHNLSGYLITKSGRLLIFSLMNNNFILPQTDIRKEMERFLYQIHEAY